MAWVLTTVREIRKTSRISMGQSMPDNSHAGQDLGIVSGSLRYWDHSMQRRLDMKTSVIPGPTMDEGRRWIQVDGKHCSLLYSP